MIPAAAPTAAITTEYMDANFPASPTPATQVSPSWPIMIWSTILNDDCSMDCSAAGTARWHTVLKNESFFFIAHLPACLPLL
jgi:hypothetical protein